MTAAISLQQACQQHCFFVLLLGQEFQMLVFGVKHYNCCILGVHFNNKSSAVAEMGDCGHIDMALKEGGAVPLSRSTGNPSTTMWPAPRSTSVPSGVFIHPAVWPQ